MVVKLCDFGLARDISDQNCYQVSNGSLELPIRTVAIESIKNNSFTTQSDVWSFGVCCWEIFSMGSQPYAELKDEFVGSQVISGYRLSCPLECPGGIFNVVRDCWETTPSERPNFVQLETSFQLFLAQYTTIPGSTKIDTDSNYSSLPEEEYQRVSSVSKHSYLVQGF